MAISRSLRYQILRRDNHTCRYCGRKAPDVPMRVDHVIPQALGGTDDPSNLVAACEDCNSGKAATPPDAALVDEVTADAERWARALAEVANERAAVFAEVDMFIDDFAAVWPVGLPVDAEWEQTLRNLHHAGLDGAAVRHAIGVATHAYDVPDQRRFRYFAGVCWNEVDRRNTMVRDRVSVPPAPPGPDPLSPALQVLERYIFAREGDDGTFGDVETAVIIALAVHRRSPSWMKKYPDAASLAARLGVVAAGAV